MINKRFAKKSHDYTAESSCKAKLLRILLYLHKQQFMKYVLLLPALLLLPMLTNAQQRNNKTPIKNVDSATSSHLKLYPTTADKYVNIYVTYDEPTDCTITLTATALSEEKKWEVKAIMSHQQSLDVTQLPPGSYIIVLSAGMYKELQTFTVKR